MNNRYIVIAIAAAALVLLSVVALFYFLQPPKQISDNKEVAQPVVTPEVTPDYTPPAPLDDKPDLNPVNQTNPFTGVKTNPFE